MGTKMKGLLKGLRYISQIFEEEEKDDDMEIGFPTDVKHVAHIGWDGPTVDSPSWMKEFSAPQGVGFSAPLNINGEPKENPEVKWVSEDRKGSNRAKNSEAAAGKDSPEVPKSSRRQSSADGSSLTADSPTRESSSTRGSRHSRRSKDKDKDKEKDSSEGSRTSRHSREPGSGGSRHSREPGSGGSRHSREPGSGGSGVESLSGALPDIPKKSRRKKSKESVGGGSTRSSRSKASGGGSGVGNGTYNSSDHGPDSGPIIITSGELSQNSSSLKPLEENGHNGVS